MRERSLLKQTPWCKRGTPQQVGVSQSDYRLQSRNHRNHVLPSNSHLLLCSISSAWHQGPTTSGTFYDAWCWNSGTCGECARIAPTSWLTPTCAKLNYHRDAWQETVVLLQPPHLGHMYEASRAHLVFNTDEGREAVAWASSESPPRGDMTWLRRVFLALTRCLCSARRVRWRAVLCVCVCF